MTIPIDRRVHGATSSSAAEGDASGEDDDSPGLILRLRMELGERFDEPSEHVLEYEGELLSGPDLTQVIGTITLRIADLEYADEVGCSAFEVLDSLDNALAHFCALVNPKTGQFRPAVQRVAGAALCRVLIIDRVEIEPKYRGRGLGLKAMDMACERLGTSCRLAVLKAFPTQWEGRVNEGPKAFAQDRSKLIEYYRRAGFKPLIGGGLMARSPL